MGIFDSLKDRLNRGSNQQQPEYYEDEYGNLVPYEDEPYDDAYDRYQADDEQGYEQGYEQDRYLGASGTGAPRRSSVRNFGFDRGDYQNDNHSPLITASDVRSAPPTARGLSRSAGSSRPARRSSRAAQLVGDDSSIYKDGLSRSPINSLTELQSERQRLEAATRIDSQTSAQPQYSLRSGLVNVRMEPRLNRQVNVINPVSYADAEKVAAGLKGGDAVVVVLTATRPELAKRILDFVFGAASALDGKVDRLADRVFAITRDAPISKEERELLQTRGVV
ncbi:MAG: cell division protein SepF [Coriobacteriales bacterium]|jgi:cell division inhibitor SepF|nr:cell division protein SepF [Coriobacteriales bacterium]